MTSDQRIVLVTGASRGIGYASAIELAKRGNHVIAVARSTKALEKLDDEVRTHGDRATLVPLDLTDGNAISQLANECQNRFGRIDALLGNAGVLGTLGPLQTVSLRSFVETIDVNLVANFRLIQAFDPVLRGSTAPRAVFVSSGVAVRPRAYWGPYQASKMGLEGLIKAWADENENSNLKINLFDPRATRTKMRAEAMPGEDPLTLPSPEAVALTLVPLLEASEQRTGRRIVTTAR